MLSLVADFRRNFAIEWQFRVSDLNKTDYKARQYGHNILYYVLERHYTMAISSMKALCLPESTVANDDTSEEHSTKRERRE